MIRKNTLLLLLLLCVTASLPAQIVEQKTPRFRIGVSGGLGYLTASGKNDIDGAVDHKVIDKLTSDLRWATNLNGDAHYLFETGWGLGIKYLFQRTSSEANDVILNPYDAVHYVVTDIWEKDYINFVGPSLFGYSAIGGRENLFLTSSLSVGYAWWRSEASMLRQNVLVTSGNLAMNTEIGIDYLFHPDFGLGVNIGYFLGTFSQVTASNGITTQKQTLDKNSRYNPSNIHLSVGLRYYLNK